MTDLLRDLWANKPEDMQILIWALHGRSSFFSDVEKAIIFAEKNGQTHDLYMGVGLRAKALTPDKRGGNDDVSAIGGLWLDVDVKHSAHQKQNLFETEEQAHQFILDATPLAPTYVIHSGHGLQAWWLFNEVWSFDIAAEHKSAADLARRWTNTFRTKANELELEIDATHDLSRVMRIPGTFNCKEPEQRVRVGICSSTDKRYAPEDFEPYLLDSPMAETEKIVIDVGEYAINPDAEPHGTKFDLLTDSNLKFRRSWVHERPDLKDQSLSAYDQSLATLSAQAGWSVQEIVDLLVAHRRRFIDPGSHKNLPDYFSRTLKLAFKAATTERAQLALTDELQVAETPEQKREILTGLFGGVHITRIVKFMSDPPTYRLETDAGTVAIPSITDLITLPKFTSHVANATRHLISKMKDDKWRIAVQSMLDIVEEESAGEEATDQGRVRGWLSAYLAYRVPTDNLQDAAQSSSPFTDEHGTYIFSSSLRQWLFTTDGDRIDGKQMGTYLSGFGCRPVVMSMPVRDGKKTTRYCWYVDMEKLRT